MKTLAWILLVVGLMQSSFAQLQNSAQTMQTSKLDDFLKLRTQASQLNYQKNPTAQQQIQMNQFVEYFKQKNNAGFDYFLSKFMASNFDISQKANLIQAKQIKANNYHVLIQSVGVNFILNHNDSIEQDLIQLQKQQAWNQEDIDYAKSVLISLPENAKIITHGINDSYPILYQQHVRNFRKDVQVIPLFLLQSKVYRNRLLEIGYQFQNQSLIDVAFLHDFCKRNQDVFISLTFPKNYYQDITEQLFPIGLTFKYANFPFNNSKENEQLWNKSLNQALSQLIKLNKRQLSLNYLPLLINLFKYYQSKGKIAKMEDIQAKIELIGKTNNYPKLAQKLGIN